MKVGMFLMLLVGLLVPMTIASKSLDFDLNTSLFSDLEDQITLEVTEFKQLKKTKSIIGKEVAESSQKRRCSVSKVDIYISAYPPSKNLLTQSAKKEEQIYRVVRYQVDMVVNSIQKNKDNYIRYL